MGGQGTELSGFAIWSANGDDDDSSNPVGALAMIRHAERHGTMRPWLVQLMARGTTKIVAVALANRTARMMWAIMTSGEAYREPVLRAARGSGANGAG